MPRKRKSDDTPSTDNTNVTSEAQTAETSTAVAEPPVSTPVEPAATAAEPPATETAARRSFAERVGQKQRPTTPDPFGIAGDYLAGVRLFESRQDRQMAIKFGDGGPDDKPSQPVIDKMKEHGYRWNPVDRIWAHPIRPDTAMSTRIEAEQLYQEVRQMIRDEKGIRPDQEVPF